MKIFWGTYCKKTRISNVNYSAGYDNKYFEELPVIVWNDNWNGILLSHNLFQIKFQELNTEKQINRYCDCEYRWYAWQMTLNSVESYSKNIVAWNWMAEFVTKQTSHNILSELLLWIFRHRTFVWCFRLVTKFSSVTIIWTIKQWQR